MAKQKMGDLLVRSGLITESDLRIALAQQKTHGGKLGEHLVRMHLLTEETLGRSLAQQLGLEFNDLTASPPSSVVAMLAETAASKLQALPVLFDPRTNTLTVAVSNPLDGRVLSEVSNLTGRHVVAQVTPAGTLRRAIEHAYFGVELRDEGTNEFQLVDINGRGKKVYVGADADLPVLNTAELMPLDDADLGGEHSALAHAPAPMHGAQQRPAAARGATPVAGSKRVAPIPAAPEAPRVRPAAAAAQDDSGEEALRTVLALADLLVERGYFTRADLMRKLRG